MVAAPPSQLLKGSSALLRRLERLEPHWTVFAMPSGGIYFFWQLGEFFPGKLASPER
jgi:hypothetical protein